MHISCSTKWQRFTYWVTTSAVQPDQLSMQSTRSDSFEYFLFLKDSDLSFSLLKVHLIVMLAFHINMDSFIVFSKPQSKTFPKDVLNL